MVKKKCPDTDEKFWRQLDKLLLDCPNISEDAREEVLACFPKNKRVIGEEEELERALDSKIDQWGFEVPKKHKKR